MANRLREEQTWLMAGSLAILAVVALGYTLQFMRPVLIPFVLSLFLTTIVSPLVDFQVLQLRVPRFLAVLVALLVLVLVFIGFGLIVLQVSQAVVVASGTYADNFAQLGRQILEWAEKQQIAVSGSESAILAKMRAEIPRVATTAAGNLASLLARAVLVFIFVGFLLAGRDPRQQRTRGVYADIDSQIRRYLITKTIISAATGILVWLCLRAFHLQLASAFGLMAFVLNFIPSVGSIIATLLPIPMAFASFPDNPSRIAFVILSTGAIQITIGNIIEPKVMGDGLKLHPVAILLSLAIWGLLWGPIGMLLAVPIMATVRIVLEQFEITQPASRLLAGTLPGLGHGDPRSAST